MIRIHVFRIETNQTNEMREISENITGETDKIMEDIKNRRRGSCFIEQWKPDSRYSKGTVRFVQLEKPEIGVF